VSVFQLAGELFLERLHARDVESGHAPEHAGMPGGVARDRLKGSSHPPAFNRRAEFFTKLNAGPGFIRHASRHA
jgi:hypothetical protein